MKKQLLFLALFAGIHAAHAHVDSPFTAISQEYLKGFATPEATEDDLTVSRKNEVVLSLPEIPVYTQFSTIFNLFKTIEIPGSVVLNKNGSKDLEIFLGEHNQQANLTHLLKRTHTSFGAAFTTYLLSHPITSIEQLKGRQSIINELATNKKLRKSITASLDRINAAENNFLFLYQDESEFNEKAIKSYFFTTNLPGFNLLKNANTSPVAMEALALKGRAVSLGITAFLPLLHFFVLQQSYKVRAYVKAEEEFRENGEYSKFNTAFNTLITNDKKELLCSNLLSSKETSFFQRKIFQAYENTEDSTLVHDKEAGYGTYIPSTKLMEKVVNEPSSYLYCADVMIPAVEKTYGKEAAQKIKAFADDYNKNYYTKHMQGTYSKAFNTQCNQMNPFKNVTNTIKPDPKDMYAFYDKVWAKYGSDISEFTWGDAQAIATSYEETKAPRYLLYGGTAAAAITQGLLTTYAVSREQNYNALTNYLHTQMMAVGSVVQEMKTLNLLIKTNKVLSKNLEYSKNLDALFNQKNKIVSDKLHQLAQLLLTDTFKGKPSYFSRKGRVLAAYALMKEIKEELAPMLLAVGALDAYVSCANLYNEYQTNDNHFVFVNYSEQATPMLDVQGMWNPFIPGNKAVANSISLGNNNPLNVILTGPNAGGKSTFSKGLTLNVLLAQTIGMVPAKECTLTPFAKINTYMNITDDTAGGNSLFKSEVLRAQELLKTIASLDKKAFSFSMMDEMFSGTSPREGEAAGYAVAKNLGANTNSIAVIATHFPKLKELETATGNFKNYQVRVVRHDNGTFSYPFKLENGFADQNVAIDILKQQGFDSSILDDANAILDAQKVAVAA